MKVLQEKLETTQKENAKNNKVLATAQADL